MIAFKVCPRCGRNECIGDFETMLKFWREMCTEGDINESVVKCPECGYGRLNAVLGTVTL